MYIKIAEVTTSGSEAPAKILFYYNRDTLFNDVSLMSTYMSKNLSTKDGNALTDDYAISDDEKDLVQVAIRATLPDIYESMAKITNAVIPAFDDDVQEYGASATSGQRQTTGTDIQGTTITIPAGHYVEFTLLDNGAYNDNVLTMVDASLYNCVKHGTLKEIYSTIVNPEFFKLCADRFVAELFKLKQRLFQLKKKSVLSNLT